MGFVNLLKTAAMGATAGVAFVTALPVFGAVGTITAIGAAVGSVMGAGGAILSELNR